MNHGLEFELESPIFIGLEFEALEEMGGRGEDRKYLSVETGTWDNEWWACYSVILLLPT